jgi:transcription elongation factor Elf1
MVEEIVKDRHPFCPQCGKKRGVILTKDSLGEHKHTNYYICCKHCGTKFNIINMGIWSGIPITLEE